MTSKYDYKNDPARLKFTRQCVDFDKDKARDTFFNTSDANKYVRLNLRQTLKIEERKQRDMKREVEIAERLGLRLKAREDLQSIRNKKLHRILELRLEGKSLKEIGAIYGVSRERIRQLGNSIPGWQHRVGCNRGPRVPRITFVCPVCKLEKAVLRSNKRTFCSRKCWLSTVDRWPKKGTKEFRLKWNERKKKYYREHLSGTPEFIEKTRIYNERYYQLKSRRKKNEKK